MARKPRHGSSDGVFAPYNTCNAAPNRRKLLALYRRSTLSRKKPALARIACSPFPALTVLSLSLLAALSIPADAGPLKAAIFPFEFIDAGALTPGNAPPPQAEAGRLALINSLLKDRLAASGAYEPVDLSGKADDIARGPALEDCQKCAEEIARAAGAEIAVVGYVQKVSNLILNINIRISNAQSGQMIAAGSADIRGNTDESWTRGVEWLVKNRLLAKPQP